MGNVSYIIRDLKSELKDRNEYEFLTDINTDYRKKIDQEYKKIENLAKAFLYNGIVFHENRDYNRATRQFKKAVKLDSNLEVYFAQSKFQRKKCLSEEQKKEIEKNIANLSSNDDEQLIKNLKESINNKEEVELKILHLNYLLYKKISLFEYMGDCIGIQYKGKLKSININPDIELKEKYNKVKDDIVKYTKKLSDFYLEKKDFQNAQRQLKGLQYTFQLFNDIEINRKLLDIYEESQNDFFGNSCINKKVIIEELVDLLNKFEPSSNEYKRVGDLIKNYSVTDENYSKFVEKIKQFEQDYKKKVNSLSSELKEISQNVVDKDILMKINFMLENLTSSNNNLSLKIGNIENLRFENKKFYQHILKIFKIIIEGGNRDLEESIQKISSRNSIETRLMLNQLLKRFERGLGNLEVAKDELDFSAFNDELKEIVSDEVNKFYTKIDNSEGIIKEKDKIIRLIQKRYGEHVFSLKSSLEKKNKEIKNLKNDWKELNQWLDEINKKYEIEKRKSSEIEKYLLKVEEEKFILEEKIKEIENKLNEIKFSLNNKRRLNKYLKKILNFEKKLDEIKKRIDIYPIKTDSNIDLHLLESDLEKIEKIMRDRYSVVYSIYCKVRFVIISVIAIITLIIYFKLV